jgi:hypothetical protein
MNLCGTLVLYDSQQTLPLEEMPTKKGVFVEYDYFQ